MQHTHAGIPVAMFVVDACGDVHGHAVHVCLGKGIVLVLFQIQLRALEFLAEHAHLQTYADGAAKEFVLIGILHSQPLMTEQSDVIVHQLETHAVIGAQEE